MTRKALARRIAEVLFNEPPYLLQHDDENKGPRKNKNLNYSGAMLAKGSVTDDRLPSWL